MKNKLDNLTLFLAIVSVIILPFLVLFGVKYDSLFYVAGVGAYAPLRIFFHYITL